MGSPTDLRPIPFWSPAEIDATIPRAIAHVQGGGLLAYPTETIYGFGGAIDTDAVGVLVGLKNRPLGKPFLLLVSSSAMIGRLGLHMTNASSMLAARFWPGPLTLVLRGAEKRVPAPCIVSWRRFSLLGTNSSFCARPEADSALFGSGPGCPALSVFIASIMRLISSFFSLSERLSTRI